MQNLLECQIVFPKFWYFRTEIFWWHIFLIISKHIFIPFKGRIFQNPKRQISEKCTYTFSMLSRKFRLISHAEIESVDIFLLQWHNLCCFHSNCQTMKNTPLGMRRAHFINDHTLYFHSVNTIIYWNVFWNYNGSYLF